MKDRNKIAQLGRYDLDRFDVNGNGDWLHPHTVPLRTYRRRIRANLALAYWPAVIGCPPVAAARRGWSRP